MHLLAIKRCVCLAVVYVQFGNCIHLVNMQLSVPGALVVISEQQAPHCRVGNVHILILCNIHINGSVIACFSSLPLEDSASLGTCARAHAVERQVAVAVR